MAYIPPNPNGQATKANSSPVVIASDQGAVTVDGSGVTQPVSAASLPLPSGASTSAKQDTSNTSLSSIDGKITAVNTGAVTVSSSALPTGAATAAKQPALGTAGTASADVITVQGKASMTPLLIDGSATTQPVSGTVTANAGTNLNTSALATSTNITGGSQKTQVVDGSGNVIGATSNALDVNIKSGSSSGTQYADGAVRGTATGTIAMVDDGTNIQSSKGDTDGTLNNNTTKLGGTAIDTNSGSKSGGTQRVVLATDQPALTNALKTDSSATTQPVSAASLPLPTGASTAAKQPALGTAGSASSDVLTVQGKTSMTPLIVDGSAVTQPVSTSTADIFPATQNITAQDVATSTVAGFNGQSYVIGNPTANSSATFTLSGIQTAAIQITGIWTGTLRVEASIDGGTTYSSKFSRLPGTVYAGSSAPTSNCLLLAAVSNYNRLRIRSSTAWTGTATITVSESINEHVVDVLNPIRLLDSTTSTLMTIKPASTAAVATDTSMVASLNPSTPLPAGTNALGSITNTSFGATQTTAANLNATVVQGAAASLTGGWPTVNGEAGDVTGTFTNATQTTNVTATNLDGYGNTLISINGTYGVATAIFEGSDDGGTTWYTVQAARDNTNVIETGYTGLTNTNQSWQINNPGFDSLRVRSTAVASGTVNVRLSSSAAPVASGTIMGIGTALPAGTNVVGKVSIDQTTPGTTNLVALAANQSVNTAQVNGAAVNVGTGAAGTGTQRVTTSTDSTIGTVAAVTAITNALPTGTNSLGKISDITTSVVPGTAATNLGKAEDAAHTTGDTGVFALAVRNDNLGTTYTNADQDYSPVAVDLNGRVMVAQKAATATLSNVAGSATTVTLLAANASRIGATLTNDSSALLYIKFGTTASTTSYTVVLAGAASAPFSYFEVPSGYTGRIDGIWASAAGNARVTEMT